MKNYLRMLAFAKPTLPYFIGGVICMAMSTVFEGVQLGAIIPAVDKIFNDKQIVLPEGAPQILQGGVDYINGLDRKFLFNSLFIFLPGLFLFKGLFFYLQGWMMNVVAQKSVMFVKNDLFEKYQQLSMDFFTKKRQGELLSRITNDAGMIAHALSYGLTDTIQQSFQVMLYVTVALMLDAKLVAIVAITFPIIAFIVFRLGKILKKISTSTQESIADLNSAIIEANQGVSIVKAFSREKEVINKFIGTNKAYYKFFIKGIRRTLLMSPITEMLSLVSVLIVIHYGGSKVMNDELSLGVFLAIIYALISIIRPVKKLSAVYGINQQALAAAQRIYDVLDLQPSVVEQPQAKSVAQPTQAIRFKNIRFKYEKNEEAWVIDNVSHDFEVGKTTALVGPTGCGKSTMLNFIPRFYDPDQGEICFDDQNIKDVSLMSLRSHIGIVTQDMILFNDTIRGNLKYGKPDATDEEIWQACEKALALEFIKNMPEGLDTRIGDRGVRLSGGQKQRLCIARAILKNPRILLLDEATSALDAESEHFVQQALDNLMENRTVIVVAHRLSTIKNADCILVMNDGRIVEKGVHDTLLNDSQLYAKLASYHFNE